MKSLMKPVRLKMTPRPQLLSVAIYMLIVLQALTSISIADDIHVWLGTSGGRGAKGIYRATLDLSNGRLKESTLVAEIKSPGFLTLHPTRDILYATGRPVDGAPSVVAYRIDRSAEKPALQLINAQEVGDGSASHLSVDPTGKMLVTAQYSGGSVAAFPLAEDGSIGDRTELIDHEGGSQVVEKRQDASHAHYAGFSISNRYVLVADLGLDRVLIYRADVAAAKLTPHGEGVTPPGSGPRHMKLHPNGKWVYVLNELSLTITVFDWNDEAGTLTPTQTLPTVSKEELDKERFKSASEIHIHPSGKFVYSANRGHDSITGFRIDAGTGKLTEVENEFIRGATPRNFNISPDGKWLLAAGQASNTLASFAVDTDSGELFYNRSVISTPTPICVLFDRPKK